MTSELKIASIDFSSVPETPSKAALWVAKIIEEFAAEAPLLSRRISINGPSGEARLHTKTLGLKRDIDVKLSSGDTDGYEEKAKLTARNGENVEYHVILHASDDSLSISDSRRPPTLDQQSS